MGTIVIRPKRQERKQAIAERWLSQSMIDWPPGAVSASRNFPGEPWRFRTVDDVRREKVEHMNARLAIKRRPGPRRRALHVWVFHVSGLIYGGWWAYLVGIGGARYYGGGVKDELDGPLLRRARELFPVGSLETLPDDRWMQAFAKRYGRGPRRRAFAPVWATVNGTRVLSLDERAKTGLLPWSQPQGD